MLEKEFVPYEEALALKELGFDEKCFCNWEESWSPEPKHEIRMVLTTDQTWLRPGWICAPTYSQAFRWFREKHSLHSNVKCINTTYNNHFRFEIESNSETLYCRNLFDTHEEAELACLRKLIEIVKQGGNNES